MPPTYNLNPQTPLSPKIKEPKGPAFGDAPVSALKFLVLSMIAGVFMPPLGFLNGVSLLFDRNTRREGIVVITWSLLVVVVAYIIYFQGSAEALTMQI